MTPFENSFNLADRFTLVKYANIIIIIIFIIFIILLVLHVQLELPCSACLFTFCLILEVTKLLAADIFH